MRIHSICMFLFPGLFQFSLPAVIVYESITPDNSSCMEPGGYGCLCDSSYDCDEAKNLECIDYKCYCRNPMHYVFDNSLRECVGLSGSVCEENVRNPRCIRNSECDAGRCSCQEGYTVTSKRTCMVTYGQPCGPYQCNIERGLACKSGRCECLDSSYTYSALSRSCFDPETYLRSLFFNVFDERFFVSSFFSLTRKFLRIFLRIPKSVLRFSVG